jgi:TMEM175 potassium channel family protein
MEGRDLSRLAAFTDGVFAIAITLLVLGLSVPQGDHDVNRRVLAEWPDLGAYFLSFAVVGRFWLVHHRFFETLRGFDAQLVRLNMAFLAFLVLVPYTTELLGDHADDTIAAVVYALVLGVIGSINWLMIRHTVRREHVREEARPAAEPLAGRAALVVPAVFFASIPVAFLNAHAAEAMWVLLFFLWPARRRRLQRTLGDSAATSS